MMKSESTYETQKKKILKHLLAGFSITPMEALKSYGCFRLAAVVFSLKKEMSLKGSATIKSELVTETKKGETKRYSKYTLLKLK